RAVLEQSEERLAGRTAELEVLQALGRRCAEAMRPGQLFATVAQVLHERAGFDVFAAALTGDRPRLRAWTARPCALPSVERVASSAWEAMDSGLAEPLLEVLALDGFDPQTAEARGFPAPVVVLLPRRGRTIAALAAAREDPLG